MYKTGYTRLRKRVIFNSYSSRRQKCIPVVGLWRRKRRNCEVMRMNGFRNLRPYKRLFANESALVRWNVPLRYIADNRVDSVVALMWKRKVISNVILASVIIASHRRRVWRPLIPFTLLSEFIDFYRWLLHVTIIIGGKVCTRYTKFFDFANKNLPNCRRIHESKQKVNKRKFYRRLLYRTVLSVAKFVLYEICSAILRIKI